MYMFIHTYINELGEDTYIYIYIYMYMDIFVPMYIYNIYRCRSYTTQAIYILDDMDMQGEVAGDTCICTCTCICISIQYM